MPGRDRRTVGDLLTDTDALAREALLDLSPDMAPAMLRTFAQVVQSAARLSSVLPPATMMATGEPDVMVRLQAVGLGIGRSVSGSRWPGPGATDERMAEMAENLSRAAALVERYGRDVQPTTPETRADIAAARDRVVHAVYLAAHGTAAAVMRYTSHVQRAVDRGTVRTKRLPEQPQRTVVPGAQNLLSRLDVFEQLAGAYVAAHPVTLAALGEGPVPPPGSRLELAIARWDIQAHRTLASQPTPSDLVRVSRTQALIATTAIVITAAAADQGSVDVGGVQRLTPTLEAAQIAWTLTANLWLSVRSPTGHADPNLMRAASDIRTAIAATAHTPTGWASPQRLAEHLDLAKTVKVLQLGMTASVDVALVMREVAAVGLGAVALSTAVSPNLRPRGEVSVIDKSSGLSLLRDASANRSGREVADSPTEPHRRRELVHQVDRVIATANSAATMTAPLTPGVPRRAAHGSNRRPEQAQKRKQPAVRTADQGLTP